MDPASFDVIDGIPHYKLFIDGQWVNSSRNRLADDINPATG
jgi:vanillin dehydrogenase